LIEEDLDKNGALDVAAIDDVASKTISMMNPCKP